MTHAFTHTVLAAFCARSHYESVMTNKQTLNKKTEIKLNQTKRNETFQRALCYIPSSIYIRDLTTRKKNTSAQIYAQML